MKKLIYIIFTIIICIQNVYAGEINWNSVEEQALSNSFDLKISETDIKITDTAIMGAKSEYYPKITTYFYSELTKSFDNNNQTVYIGNEVLYGDSVFQTSLSVGLTYNLYDFGIRGDRLKIAKSDKLSKLAQYDKILRDTEISAVDTYAKSLLLYKQICLLTQTSALQNELYNDKERLHKAGKIPETSVLAEKIKFAEINNELQKTKNEFEKSLKDLSYLTKNDYSKDDVLVDFDYGNLKQKEEILSLDVENIPEAKIYDAEIKKKEKELLIAKKQNLPAFNFTTNYYLYGADPNNYFDSYENFKQRGLKFRIITSLPIFDGFKNKSDRDRIKLEILRLQTEKEKKIAEVKYTYEKIRDDAVYGKILHENNLRMKEFLAKNISDFDRLNEQKLIDKDSYLEQKISLLNKYFEIEKSEITEFVSAHKLDLMTKNSGENI